MNKRYSDGIRLFGKYAIRYKGSDFQRDLLEAAKLDGPSFVDWLDKKIDECIRLEGRETGVVEGDDEVSLPSVKKITAGTFINPPENVMVEWYKLWSGISLSDASSPGFWGYVTRRMIEQGKILPSYLALDDPKNGSNGEDAGLNCIEDALGNPEKMDKCVRNFCRRLSGLPERGSRSLYVDCCLARAWWKCHVCESSGGENWQQSTLPIMGKDGVWGDFGEKITSRLTAIGDINIRDGIIQFLASDEGKEYRKKGGAIVSLLLRVGVRASWCAMGIFTPEEVCEQVVEIVRKK